MVQYGDVKPATEVDVSGKLEALQRLRRLFKIDAIGILNDLAKV